MPPAQTCAGHHNSSIVLDVFVNRSQSFRNFDVVSCEFAIRRCESTVRAMRRSVGFGALKLTTNFACDSVVRPIAMSRKPRNFNEVDSKFERGVGESHAKFGGGVLPEVSGCQGFRVAIELQADGPQAACCQGFRVLELCAA